MVVKRKSVSTHKANYILSHVGLTFLPTEKE